VRRHDGVRQGGVRAEVRRVGLVGRLAAVGAVVAAIVVVAILLFGGGGGGYTVKAHFLNAGQLVAGNQVEIGGTPVGTVDDIQLSPDGQAVVTLTINDENAPLRQGTRATVRQASLSGIANRYVDLSMPPGDSSNTSEIPDGGSIGVERTTTAVDLDQVFAIFDPHTRTAVQDFFKNSAAEFKGKEEQQRLAYHYLNPALSTSSRLFNELNRDNPLLSHFLIDSSKLVTALAEKRDDLSALIANANSTFRALGNQKVALAEAISRLPGFMRQANTTFVDLRSALDDLDPLVNASKPVAKKLGPFLNELRPLARDARPTVRDLSRIVYQKGPDNDLNDLQHTFPPLKSAALDTKQRSIDFGTGPKDVGNVRGSFQESTQALTDSAPIVGFGRPYTVDFDGWADDFSTTGSYDALGGFSRAFTVFNAFDASGNALGFVPLSQRFANNQDTIRINQFKRCPGASEEPAADGSNVWSDAEMQAMDCLESGRATGEIKTP
jgi:phospholipid/cholesterol/gamma-HCH transport system substrate-binding protein